MGRVLVVGCGLAGLAAARGLRALGLDVDAIEIRTDLCEPGAGLLLTGNAIAMLDALGLGEAVRAAGRTVHTIAYSDESGDELFRLELAQHPRWGEFVSIHRHALQRILLGHEAAVPVRAGVGIDGLEPRDARVRVRFSSGESADYDLVVGADGVHSRVRALLFDAAAPAAIPGFSGWRFVTRCPPELTHALTMLGNGRSLLLHPLAGGDVYCGAGPIEGMPDSDAAGDERLRLRAAFASFGGPAKSVLENVDEETTLIPTRYWQASHITWSRGRCVLIGDAAHTCAPTLSQGAALAFEDAAVLSEMLSGADTLSDGPALEACLQKFAARRTPRVEPVMRESRARMEANREVDPARLTLRNQVLRKVGAPQLAAVWTPLMEQRP